MQLMQWNPFREMDDLLARFRTGFPVTSEAGAKAVAEWAPFVDITESDKEYLVKADLPGVKKDDVKLTMQNGVLTISGERKFEKEEKDEKYHRIERAFGSFTRSFSLPEDVLQDKIVADAKEGVIRVHLPKTDIKKVKATQIKVQ